MWDDDWLNEAQETMAMEHDEVVQVAEEEAEGEQEELEDMMNQKRRERGEDVQEEEEVAGADALYRFVEVCTRSIHARRALLGAVGGTVGMTAAAGCTAGNPRICNGRLFLGQVGM